MRTTGICLLSDFKSKRILELKKEYENSITDIDILKKTQDLRSQISKLLGKDNADLLQEYTNLIVSSNDKNAEWFYTKGFDDSLNFATQYIMFS